MKIKMNKAVEDNIDPCKIKWIKCPQCRKNTSFNTEEPIVDLLFCNVLKIHRQMKESESTVVTKDVNQPTENDAEATTAEAPSRPSATSNEDTYRAQEHKKKKIQHNTTAGTVNKNSTIVQTAPSSAAAVSTPPGRKNLATCGSHQPMQQAEPTNHERAGYGNGGVVDLTMLGNDEQLQEQKLSSSSSSTSTTLRYSNNPHVGVSTFSTAVDRNISVNDAQSRKRI